MVAYEETLLSHSPKLWFCARLFEEWKPELNIVESDAPYLLWAVIPKVIELNHLFLSLNVTAPHGTIGRHQTSLATPHSTIGRHQITSSTAPRTTNCGTHQITSSTTPHTTNCGTHRTSMSASTRAPMSSCRFDLGRCKVTGLVFKVKLGHLL